MLWCAVLKLCSILGWVGVLLLVLMLLLLLLLLSCVVGCGGVSGVVVLCSGLCMGCDGVVVVLLCCVWSLHSYH